MTVFFSAARAEPLQHTTLTIGVQQYPNTFHPNTDSSSIREYILAMARPDLTTYDADWKLICYLCTELPSYEAGTAHIETDAAGKQHVVETFTLQPDAKWDDGVPVTTKDVLFSLEVGRSPKSGYVEAELYTGDTASTIEDIKALTEKSFEVRLKGVPCDYQSLNDFRIIPEHIERKVFEADPDTYRIHTIYDTDPTTRGLWYGPYRISRIARGASVELERNPYWWGKRPAFDHIRILTFENTSTIQSALVSGEVDYLPGEIGIPENIAAAIAKRYPDRFDVIFKPSLVDQHIDLNLDNPIFEDVRVRQALLLGVDRPTINDAIYEGRYQIQTSFADPLDSIYSDDVLKYGYDPKRAADLLDQAGWTGRDGGIRTNAQGQRLSLVLSTTAGDRRREELEQALAWYWKQIGIDIRLKNQPARILFGQTLPHRQYEGMALYSWTMAPRNIPRSEYSTQSIPTAANGYAGENFIGWSNPEMDSLLNDMETRCEPVENQAAWTRAERLYTEQLPSLPLFYRSDAFVLPKWLKGVKPTGHQYPSSMWVQDWYAGND